LGHSVYKGSVQLNTQRDMLPVVVDTLQFMALLLKDYANKQTDQ